MTSVAGCASESSLTVLASTSGRRAVIITRAAFAAQKFRAMARPMPVDAPQTRTVRPAWEISGRVGDVPGYGLLWSV